MPSRAASPGWLLRKRGGAGADEPGQQQHHEADQRAEEERWVVCSNCQHPLARTRDRIEVAGRHLHTCVNPHGYVYRIALYRRAEGAVSVGDWSDFHSWFAGTFWQVACCRACSIHIGWSFTGEAGDFHGLIADRIEERAA